MPTRKKILCSGHCRYYNPSEKDEPCIQDYSHKMDNMDCNPSHDLGDGGTLHTYQKMIGDVRHINPDHDIPRDDLYSNDKYISVTQMDKQDANKSLNPSEVPQTMIQHPEVHTYHYRMELARKIWRNYKR